MNRKKAIIVSFGIACFALVIAYSYVTDIEHKFIKSNEPIKVAVAIKDIPEGTRLDESYLTLKAIPKIAIQPGASIGNYNNLIDKVVLIPLLKDTQILDSMFLISEKEGISSKIPPGMRAVSIAATEVSAASGLAQPGDYVDIAASVQKANINNQVGSVGVLMEEIISI